MKTLFDYVDEMIAKQDKVIENSRAIRAINISWYCITKFNEFESGAAYFESKIDAKDFAKSKADMFDEYKDSYIIYLGKSSLYYNNVNGQEKS